ncbi:MAG: AAA family ATPase [Clostridium sp.]|uniref:AAA family ATPase n=1 Tax=Clostridium sp. TaxID=1506 RepID=UPI003F36CB84
MINLMDIQPQKMDSNIENYSMLLYGKSKVGKAQPVDTVIPTPNGEMKFGDLKIGDKVYDRMGKPTKVTGIFPQGVIDNYKVTLCDGREFFCNEEHIIPYINLDRRNICNKTLKEMMVDYKVVTQYKGKEITKHKYRVPLNEAIYKEEKEYKISPYALGLLIGDGCLTMDESCINFSNDEEDLVAKLSDELDIVFRWHSEHNYNNVARVSYSEKNIKIKDINEELTRLELNNKKSGEKFIPTEYKEGSIEQRLELIRGLVDTDGSVDLRKNSITFTTTSERLTKDFLEVCRSLGMNCKVKRRKREDKPSEEFTIVIYSQYKIFSSVKHSKRWNNRTVGNNTFKFRANSIVNIEKVGQAEMMCIKVSNYEELYLTNDYIVTHNTKFLHDLYGERALFLFTEDRFKHLHGANVLRINSWSDYLNVMSQLQMPQIKEKFDTIIIDTLDNLAVMCEQFTTAKWNENTLGELTTIYGKDWADVKRFWRDGIQMIPKLGYNFAFAGHSSTHTLRVPINQLTKEAAESIGAGKVEVEEEIEGQGKVKVEYFEVEQYVPDLHPRYLTVVENQVDNIVFMNIGLDENGNEERFLHLRETLQYRAGCTFESVNPIIKSSAENLREELKKAVDKIPNDKKESKEKVQVVELNFNELYEEAKGLAIKYKEVGRVAEYVSITESVIGVGNKLSNCTEKQVDVVKSVVDKLKRAL